MPYVNPFTQSIPVQTTERGYVNPLTSKVRRISSDLSTTEGLRQKAEELGLGRQATDILDETPRLSFLQRIGAGFSALNPAEAILTGVEEGVGAGLLEYPKSILRSIGSAITGRDFQGGRRYFKDVAEELGVENGIAKFGIGFVGDVLLDPGTYFGGAIAKGIGLVAKGGAKLGFGAIRKATPDVAQGLQLVGTGLQDALGRAFQYGFKATKGAKDDVLSFLSRQQQAKIGLAGSNLDRLGTGVLTMEQRTELALKMIAGKRAEFAAREAGKTIEEAGKVGRQVALEGTSKEVGEVIEKQLARSAKVGEELGLENPYEVYFPFIKQEKVAKFLSETRGFRVGSEGYRKQFKNLLTNENLELDPAKAFFTRESQIVTDRMTRNFLNGFVGKYGKPLSAFDNSDEAAKAGWQLIKEKGIFGKELGYVSQYDAAIIRDSISPEFQTINMLAKATGFDAVTSLFKRSVTGLFAPFHIRNFVSGQIQNYEVLGVSALNPKNIAVGQKIAYLMGKGKDIPEGTITLGGKTMKFKSVMKAFVDRFSGDTFYNADFDTALKAGAELEQVRGLFSIARLKTTGKTLGLGTEAIPFKVGRAVGQFIEHQQKATAYVTALSQGKGIKEALRLAEVAGFDYRALTRFESQIMRRLIPFYSFTRKNIGLQLKTMGENPQRINHVVRFFANVGDTPTEEEKKALPDFIKETLGVKLQDTPEGLKQYISTFGTPIEAFTQLFSGNPILGTISTFNPLVKVPIELGIGKDSFRERDLQEVYDAREYKLAPQILKDLLDITEVQRDVLKKDKSGKLVRAGERTEYVADPVRLLIARSLFTSRGVSYLDQVFGNDLQGFVKLLKVATGIKPQPINIEAQAAFKEKKQKRELEDLLIRRGADVRRFERVYEPK